MGKRLDEPFDKRAQQAAKDEPADNRSRQRSQAERRGRPDDSSHRGQPGRGNKGKT